jgi:hypothetical protein
MKEQHRLTRAIDGVVVVHTVDRGMAALAGLGRCGLHGRLSWAACTIVGAAKLAATVANIAISVLMDIVGLLQMADDIPRTFERMASFLGNLLYPPRGAQKAHRILISPSVAYDRVLALHRNRSLPHTVKAPEKHLVWFEHSAHMPMTEEPGKFLLSLVRCARPIAEKAGDAAP